MSEITRVALDAMGGDNAPGEIVKGAVEAVQRRDDIKILLTGKEEVLKKELSAYLSKGTDRNCKCYRGDRDSRAAGESYPWEKRFFYCSSNEDGEKGRGRCICICRKFRCSPRWRSGACRTY